MHPIISAAGASATISFNSIDETLGKMAEKADKAFNDAMEKFKTGDQSTASALEFQRESQAWKFSQDAVAKVTENFGDIMKSIIQKS
jgi:ribosomal protein S1